MMELDGKTVQGDDRSRFNRMLLADAYPQGDPLYRRRALHQRQACGEPGLAGLYLLPHRPFHRRRVPEEVLRPQDPGVVRLAERAVCVLIFCKLGWFSVACVFLSYFFMSIMFPTIFALGIFGLGARAKKASSYIVMAIMGGAVLPKLMGYVADQYDMSRSFIVPWLCFAFVALYGFLWPKLAHAESLHGAAASGGH